jgi:hypothetical protein
MWKRLLLVGSLTLLLGVAPLSPSMADTDVTASNESDDVETETGDAEATNSGSAQVGHNGGGDTDITTSDIDNEDATNVQEGDNSLDASQSATSSSGSGVTGQVIGAVAEGDLTIDATNSTTDSDVETGEAASANDFAAFVGLDASTQTTIAAADVTNQDATNVQEGDNGAGVDQFSDASSGDAVTGQIVGGTATGNSVITVANTSDDTDATSGDSDQESTSDLFTGLLATGVLEDI